MKVFRERIPLRIKPVADGKMMETRSDSEQYLSSFKHIILCALILGMMGVMILGVQGYARGNWAGETETSRQRHAGHRILAVTGTLTPPAGLYVQEWYPDPTTSPTPWPPAWSDWAEGAEQRVPMTSILSGGNAYAIDRMLENLPEGKTAIIGFSPKNNTKDCYFGMWDQYYTDLAYTPLRLKNANGEDTSRTCGGVEIETAVDLLNPIVQGHIRAKIEAFVDYYTNQSAYKDKVAGFEFASGTNLEGTPWVHPTYHTKTDDGYEFERKYEKLTYEDAYTGTEWAEYNLAFAHWIDDALENAGSDKIAYINYTQTWPSISAWQDVIHCIGGETRVLCPDEDGEYSPITSGYIGLKHSGLAADTLTGGSYEGCSWYKSEPGDFWGDWWKMMSWARGKGIPTNWEFNNDMAVEPLDEVYGNEAAHVRNSLGMALSYGADVILIYQDNQEHRNILEWASSYTGQSIDASLERPVWIMLREAIEDIIEEGFDDIKNEISDPEDVNGDGGLDGYSCAQNGVSCSCGHDVQAGFGIQVDLPNGIGDTSWGEVAIDDTVYGASARRANNGQLLKFEVNDNYMLGASQAEIVVIYRMEGSHPEVQYWYNDGITQGEVTITSTNTVDKGDGWWEATFIADDPDFSNSSHEYDFMIDSKWGLDWIDFVSVARHDTPPTPTPEATPTRTPTPTPEPAPDFREQMEGAPIGQFDSHRLINGATLTQDDERLEGDFSWKCAEGNQLQNWPECEVSKNLPTPQDHLVVEYTVRIDSATQLGPVLSSDNGFLWPYFDLYHQLHLFCMPPMCDDTEVVDVIPGHVLQPGAWYRIRIEALRDVAGPDSVTVTAYAGGHVSQGSAVWTYHQELVLQRAFTVVRMFTRFGIDNGWDERVYWDDFKIWYTQTPNVHSAVRPYPQGGNPEEKKLRHGVDGYWSSQDTYIVSTNWEPPTPHGSHSLLYVRTNGTEGEVMSSLIKFEEVYLPPITIPYHATLSVYFAGQSVNGGATTVHVAGVKPDWDAAQTTWLQYLTGHNWQIAGAKGENDRTAPGHSLVVDYTDVGKWLEFEVTELVRQGYISFILYGEHEGVNKAIYFPSNEYWDASKRPKLKILYD